MTDSVEMRNLLDAYEGAVYGSADDSYPVSDKDVAVARRGVESFVLSLIERAQRAEKELAERPQYGKPHVGCPSNGEWGVDTRGYYCTACGAEVDA